MYKELHPFHVAMTCCYLACKINENQRKHRDILTVFDRICCKRNNNTVTLPLDAYSSRYKIWRDILMKLELRVLAKLGYINIIGKEYHKYLLHYMDELDVPKKLAKQAWTYLNDLNRIPQILEYNETMIACACILLSSRKLKIKLPDNPSWLGLFGVNKNDLFPIASIILELYELPPKLFDTLPNGFTLDKTSLDVVPKILKSMTTMYDKNTQNNNNNNNDNSKSKELSPIIKSQNKPIIITKNIPTNIEVKLDNKDNTNTNTTNNENTNENKNNEIKESNNDNDIEMELSDNKPTKKRRHKSHDHSSRSHSRHKYREHKRKRDKKRSDRERRRDRDRDRDRHRDRDRDRDRERDRDRDKYRHRDRDSKDKNKRKPKSSKKKHNNIPIKTKIMDDNNKDI